MSVFVRLFPALRCQRAALLRGGRVAAAAAGSDRRLHSTPRQQFRKHRAYNVHDSDLLRQRLSERFGEGKQGLGFETGSLALKEARESLIKAIHDKTSNEVLAEAIQSHYYSLKTEEAKKAFFAVLVGDFGIDHDKVVKEAEKLRDLHSQHGSEEAVLHLENTLRRTARPPYAELFSLISYFEGGMKFLVEMRDNLLELIKKDKDAFQLAMMEDILHRLLERWFSVNTLRLEQITWQSPCDILEKISQSEKVHPVRRWKDLKRRVSSNRRCFIFTHPSIPREPLVILYTALTRQPAVSIQALLKEEDEEEELGSFKTAVFYSITVPHKGLSGIDLGNFMIQRAVQELQREFKNQFQNFVTLSPIPGFRSWLDSHLKQHIEKSEGCKVTRDEVMDLLQMFPESANHVEALQTALANWTERSSDEFVQALRAPLTRLCTRYLAREKHRGRALDPVCHFHLSNGASLWRLNWQADTSSKGVQQSYGFMVNYKYEDTSDYSGEYLKQAKIQLSDSLRHYLPES